MKQWMLRITAYADRLLEDLDDLDWSDSIKEMQRNWIGRSEVRGVRKTLGKGGGGGSGVQMQRDWIGISEVRGVGKVSGGHLSSIVGNVMGSDSDSEEVGSDSERRGFRFRIRGTGLDIIGCGAISDVWEILITWGVQEQAAALDKGSGAR